MRKKRIAVAAALALAVGAAVALLRFRRPTRTAASRLSAAEEEALARILRED